MKCYTIIDRSPDRQLYRLSDNWGKIKVLSENKLKERIRKGKINITNVTLTSDGKLRLKGKKYPYYTNFKFENSAIFFSYAIFLGEVELDYLIVYNLKTSSYSLFNCRYFFACPDYSDCPNRFDCSDCYYCFTTENIIRGCSHLDSFNPISFQNNSECQIGTKKPIMTVSYSKKVVDVFKLSDRRIKADIFKNKNVLKELKNNGVCVVQGTYTHDCEHDCFYPVYKDLVSSLPETYNILVISSL